MTLNLLTVLSDEGQSYVGDIWKLRQKPWFPIPVVSFVWVNDSSPFVLQFTLKGCIIAVGSNVKHQEQKLAQVLMLKLTANRIVIISEGNSVEFLTTVPVTGVERVYH